MRKPSRKSAQRDACVKAVVDTNIWISSLIASSKTAGGLVDAWRDERFKLVISQQQLTELAEVLHRGKFLNKYRFDMKEVADILDSIAANADRVTLKGDIRICRDPDDDIIMETAARGKVKYLVTGDKDITDDNEVLSYLSRHGVSVVTLSHFLTILNKA